MLFRSPTGGVDPRSRRQFWELIEHLAAGGVTVLVTTHYLDEAEHCDRLAIIQAGRLAALGTVRELKDTFADRAIVELQSSRPIDVVRVLDALPEVAKTSVFGTAVHAVIRAGTATPLDLVRELDTLLTIVCKTFPQGEIVH